MPAFIETLFNGKDPRDWVCVWTGWDTNSHWTRDLADAERYAQSRAGDADVYVSMGLSPEEKGKKQRVRPEQVIAIPGVWADIDVAHGVHKKTNLPPDGDAALEVLRALPLPWSLLVDSGHGFQVYWLFPQVWRFATPDERRRAAALVSGWQATVKRAFAARGWDVDSVHNLDRLLRVAGTVNRKERTDVRPVVLVEDSGARYTVEQIEPYARSAGQESFAARLLGTGEGSSEPPQGRYSAGQTDGPALVLAGDAEPPLDKLEAARTNDPKFRRTWERRRPDLRDQSSTGYDYALAVLAIQYGWTDQEVADLLIAGRRINNEPLRLDGDYYARTIYNARAAVGQEAAAEALAQGRAHDDDERASTAAGETPRDERDDVLRTLSTLLRAPVVRFIQLGKEQSHYSLVLADGKEVHLGMHVDLLSADRVRGRLLDQVGVVLPVMKKQQWIGVVGQMMTIRELIENVETDRVPQLIDWVRSHLDGNLTHATTPEELGEAVGSNSPFLRDGHLFLQASGLRKHILFSVMQDIEPADLHDRLRATGFIYRKVSARHMGRVFNRGYWHAPATVIEEHSEEL